MAKKVMKKMNTKTKRISENSEQDDKEPEEDILLEEESESGNVDKNNSNDNS